MFAKILVPVELSHGEVGARSVSMARQLAGTTGELILLNVAEEIPGFIAASIPQETVEASRAQNRMQIEALARAAGPHTRVVLREGKPSAEILAEAKASGVDLILIGSHRPNLTDYLLGSTAARVVRHAQCSVLVDRSAVA